MKKKQKEIDNFFKTASPKKKIDYKKLAETIKEINKPSGASRA